MRKIRKVGVLGAGVMGSGIAAHLANAGIPSVLLDIVPPNLTDAEKQDPSARNRFALNGIANLLKSKPALIYLDRLTEFIKPGNFEDNLDLLADCDWIVEVVLERLDIKKSLFQKILPFLNPGQIVSSNTSGISIASMTEGLPAEFKKSFLVTHFFNPVRYMRLLEIVVGPDTDQEVVDTIVTFGREVLGKGIVFGKDTPNFVANRIGVYGIAKTVQVMMEMNLTPEEVDTIVGPPMGRPKSAAFRTADLVGLDTLVHVLNNVYENLPHDDERDVFIVPEFMKKMIEKGMTGDKNKQGFYKKIEKDGKKEVYSIDYKTVEYKPQVDTKKFDSIKATKGTDNSADRLKILLNSDDIAAKFAWRVMSEGLVYAAKRIGEIADDIVNIDNAMKWGFNWDMGPFEAWDAIGVAESIERMEKDGLEVPEKVKKVLTQGKGSFYLKENGKKYFFDFVTGSYKPVEIPAEVIFLGDCKEQGKTVRENFGASLVDIGDGVLCLEFHTKMNAIDGDVIDMIFDAADEVEQNWEGLVISNHGENFSVGANLALIVMVAKMGNFSALEEIVRRFQGANMRLKYMRKPVVAAPFGLTLGGGCEVTIHCPNKQVAAELYMGLVEVGVGVIPAGAGTKETLVRCLEGVPKNMETSRMPFIQRAFENIGMAKVGVSAMEVRKLGYLSPTDGITLYRDRLIYDAKQKVLGLAKSNYKPPLPPDNMVLPGKNGYGAFEIALYSMRLGNYLTEYDHVVGKKLAWILCGGDCNPREPVTEQHLLDLECEAFLSLCGDERTQARMEHMLKTGKPLRN
jgi:3-hydroxyacyl-CoA dehydrogenase